MKIEMLTSEANAILGDLGRLDGAEPPTFVLMEILEGILRVNRIAKG